MNLSLKALLFTVLCVSLVNASFLDLFKKDKKSTEENVGAKKVVKRQVPFLPDGSFMDYAAYDYYDWVCSNGACNLCDVLTGACCNPNQANCFLPDSCANNPCLSGGTCVPSLTVQHQPDFVCICQRGLTGKYCQLIDEFTPPMVAPIIPPSAAPAQGYAAGASSSYGVKPVNYVQPPQQQPYGQQQPPQQYGQPAYGQPAYGQQPQAGGFGGLGAGLQGGLGAGLQGGLGAGLQGGLGMNRMNPMMGGMGMGGMGMGGMGMGGMGGMFGGRR